MCNSCVFVIFVPFSELLEQLSVILFGEEEAALTHLLPRIERDNIAQDGIAVWCCWKQALRRLLVKWHDLKKANKSSYYALVGLEYYRAFVFVWLSIS